VSRLKTVRACSRPSITVREDMRVGLPVYLDCNPTILAAIIRSIAISSPSADGARPFCPCVPHSYTEPITFWHSIRLTRTISVDTWCLRATFCANTLTASFDTLVEARGGGGGLCVCVRLLVGDPEVLA